MRRSRVLGVACLAAGVMVIGGCGSSSTPAGAPPRPPAAAPKLRLATASRGADGSARTGAEPAIFPVRPTKYVLDGTLPDLGTSAVVWRMTPHPVTAADVAHFAAVLGVAASPVSSATGWDVVGADAQLHVFTGNGDASVSYVSGAPGISGGSGGSTGSGIAPDAGGAGTSAPGSPPPAPVNSATPETATPQTVTPQTVTPQTVTRKNVPPVPTPEPVVVPTPTGPVATVAPPVGVPGAADAEQAARAVLDRLGVLAGQQWSTAVTDSGGVAVACAVGTPCPTVPPQVFSRTVTFAPKLDGRVVQSAGWSVTIGERARIDSLDGEWATPVSIGTYALATTASRVRGSTARDRALPRSATAGRRGLARDRRRGRARHRCGAGRCALGRVRRIEQRRRCRSDVPLPRPRRRGIDVRHRGARARARRGDVHEPAPDARTAKSTTARANRTRVPTRAVDRTRSPAPPPLGFAPK